MRRLGQHTLSLAPQLTRSSEPLSVRYALLSAALLSLLSLFYLGCEQERPPAEPSPLPATAGEVGGEEAPSCVPECEGRACGVDPRCGTSCGSCAEGERCEAAQCLVEEGPTAAGSDSPSAGVSAGAESVGGVSACEESCEALGAECGEACGASCGVCAEGSSCEGHRCVCTPQCAGRACGEADGCGGTCSPCPRAESCEGCALRLRVLSMEERGGQVTGAKVALSLNFPEGAPHPEIADLQLDITGPVILGRVGLSPVVIGAGKQLIPNPATGLPYRVDGHRYSFMIMSTQNTDEIPSGDWLILDLMIGDTSAAPVQLQVVQREQTFAPPPADLQLWGASLGEGLVIWPALSQGE